MNINLNETTQTKEVTAMVIQMKQELVAAGLRQQIASLAQVMEDMEWETLDKEALGWRLRAVELQLRRLREAA